MKRIKNFLISIYGPQLGFSPKPNNFPVPLAEIQRVRDLNQIASSIEKVQKMLHKLEPVQQAAARQTWQIVLANLRSEWRDAVVETHSRSNTHQYQ